jgi:hypothetical protein
MPLCPSGCCVPKQTDILLISAWDNKARIDVEHIFVLYSKSATNKSKLSSFLCIITDIQRNIFALFSGQLMALIFLEICYEICFMAIHCHRKSSSTCSGYAFRVVTYYQSSLLQTRLMHNSWRPLMGVNYNKLHMPIGLFKIRLYWGHSVA